jgi:hypothetical protein
MRIFDECAFSPRRNLNVASALEKIKRKTRISHIQQTHLQALMTKISPGLRKQPYKIDYKSENIQAIP